MGTYEQKKKEPVDGEEEEAAEGEGEEGEGAIKKDKFNLIWCSDTNIAEAAHKVNSVEQ